MLDMMKTEVETVRKAEDALRSCLADVPFLKIEDLQAEPVGGEKRPDLAVKLRMPTGEVTLLIEVKLSGQPRIARQAVMQIERMATEVPNAYGVFVAPYISARSADICIQRNVGYMDLAGNCRLNFWPVYIKTVSERNPFAQTRDLRSLYSPTSVKTAMILRVLLENPKRVWKTKDLVNEAGASLGQVASVKKQLTDREWVRSDSEGFRLTDPSSLLIEWSENYDLKRNKITDYYSLKSVPEIEAELADFCSREGITYTFTGFSGGARYAPAVRYQRVTAYVAAGMVAKVADALNLKPVNSGANLSLISPNDANVLYASKLIDGACIASPSQVYLDLRSLRARGEEAADAVLKGAIEPRWR